jgi:hypothetical protein
MLRELVAISALIALPEPPIQHGTCVLTLSTMDSIVMAADGQTHFESPTNNPKAPYDKQTEEGESKIAICGRRFICATAGINPMNYEADGISVHYAFQQWISTIVVDEDASVSDFADAVQKQARKTFHDMDAVLKRDDFWNSEAARESALFTYRIAGFSEEAAEFCDIALQVDRDNRRLIYRRPECKIRRAAGSFHLSTLVGTHYANSVTALTSGTPQAAKLAELKPVFMNTAKALLPDSPPALQEIAAIAAALVSVEGEFNPQNVGGTPRIGILVEGQLPKVCSLPIESLGRSEAHHFCSLAGDTKANTANSPVTATL